MTDTESKTFITKETVKRLAKDVKDIIRNPLTDSGIYYVHNQEDMLKGQALIVGPRGTPYEGGYYFFKFQFPSNYPHQPPVLTYCTNDGVTRFNPNLYKCGKVCVSILNTWRGPQWTGCQSISSILLCLCGAVLNEKPLLNEPGLTEKHDDFQKYNQIVAYKNFEVGIARMLESSSTKEAFPELHSIACQHFVDNYANIVERLEEMSAKDDTIQTNVYSMRIVTNWKDVERRLKALYTSIKN